MLLAVLTSSDQTCQVRSTEQSFKDIRPQIFPLPVNFKFLTKNYIQDILLRSMIKYFFLPNL